MNLNLSLFHIVFEYRYVGVHYSNLIDIPFLLCSGSFGGHKII